MGLVENHEGVVEGFPTHKSEREDDELFLLVHRLEFGLREVLGQPPHHRGYERSNLLP